MPGHKETNGYTKILTLGLGAQVLEENELIQGARERPPPQPKPTTKPPHQRTNRQAAEPRPQQQRPRHAPRNQRRSPNSTTHTQTHTRTHTHTHTHTYRRFQAGCIYSITGDGHSTALFIADFWGQSSATRDLEAINGLNLIPLKANASQRIDELLLINWLLKVIDWLRW